jgi:ABC-2 type transport system permease protein
MRRGLRIIRHVLWKEFIQVFRDHQMVRLLAIMPLLQIILLGYAITSDVRHLPLRILDYDHSPESRELTEHFRYHRTFDLQEPLPGPQAVRSSLDRGTATAVLVIPAGFSRRLGRGEATSIQLLMDGVDSNASLIASNQARGITENWGIGLVTAQRGTMPLSALQPRVTVLYNPELESRYFMVPGIVVLVLTMLTSILTRA